MDDTPESRKSPGAEEASSGPLRQGDGGGGRGGGRGGGVASGVSAVAELSGDLRCIRCGYNLRGLSIMGVCPECSTPIRATLLHAVDPQADELQPIRRPRVLATGLVMWSAGALLAAVSIWGLRIADLGDSSSVASHVRLLRLGAPFFLVISGIGALTLIRPHAGLPRFGAILAAIAAGLYVPLVMLTHELQGRYDASHLAPFANLQPPQESRALFRLAASAVMLGILLCLRRNARVLAQRSVVMRKGGTNRQILLGLAGAVALTMVGDLLHLGSVAMNEPVGGPIFLAGNGLIIAGSLLMTFGLVSALIDTLRLRRVILDPPLTLRKMIAPEDRAR